MGKWPDIGMSVIGLEDKKPCLAHSNGGWGPENKDSDWDSLPLVREGDRWVFKHPEKVLQEGEQFKILVEDISPEEARDIHRARVNAGVHIGGPRTDNLIEDFDYDPKTQCMWFLADDDPDGPNGGYPIIRGSLWNRNNVLVRVRRELP